MSRTVIPPAYKLMITSERPPRRRSPLEFLTKSYDVAVGDDAGGEVEEGFVNVVAAFPPDA